MAHYVLYVTSACGLLLLLLLPSSFWLLLALSHEWHWHAITVECDASPFGGGAVAWCGGPQGRHGRWPFAWISCTWTTADAELLECELGTSGGQARWEAFMMLLALRQWLSHGAHGIVSVVGDAEGVLGALTRMRSDDPIINLITMELALWIAPRGLSLEGLHIWGEENEAADDLSRLSRGVALPRCLAGVAEEELLPRAAAVWTFLGK